MSITVNTNLSSLICQRSLSNATMGMNTALQRMSTGLRINSAKDDAAGMAISSKMNAKLSSYAVAQDNAQMGQSMIDTASGSLSVMNGMLQRMRDLAEQASNGTYGTEERKAMQAEVDALTEEIYRIKNTTEFNGKKILGAGEKYNPVSSTPDISMNEIDTSDITQHKGKVIGISNADELAKIAEITNAGQDTTGITFALTSDIDLSSIDNWNTIGVYRNKFCGDFDGNGYTISNLTINKPTSDYQGLFGFCSNANIQNVNLENVDITANTVSGALSGALDNSSVTNCHISGKISGNNMLGGLTGWNYQYSVISNCSTNITVNGTTRTGGMVGVNSTNSTIINSYSTGSVIGTRWVGGLSGQNYNQSTIENCYATGSVKGTQTLGGLVGYNGPSDSSITTGSTIINSWASGYIDSTTTTNIGGLVGYNAQDSSIIDCSFDKLSSGGWDGYGTDNSGGKINPNPIPSVSSNPLSNITNKNSFELCSINLQVGINSDSNSVISVDSGFEMGNFSVSLTTEYSARNAIDKIDTMLEKINNKALELGAASNRLTSTMEFQSAQMSALTSASSLIKDADIAKESASYIKNQILQQTTATLLATANQNPSIALSLV